MYKKTALIVCGVLAVLIGYTITQQSTTSSCTLSQRKCQCTKNSIDCTLRDFKEFPDAGLWAEILPKDFNATNMEMFFDSNEIETISYAGEESRVVKLSLTYCMIKQINRGAFHGFTGLRCLNLAHNNLNELFNMFKSSDDDSSHSSCGSITLMELYLSHNSISTLTGDVFKCVPKLKVLHLNNNPLEKLDVQTVLAINSLEELEILDISYTGLFKIDSQPQLALPSLMIFSAAGNPLPTLPYVALKKMTSLKEANFNNSEIVEINSKSLPAMMTLKKLSVSNMPNLTYIGDDAFSGIKLPQLEMLNISANPKLTAFSPKAINSVTLKLIDLSDNSNLCIPRDDLKAINENMTILGNNSPHCNRKRNSGSYIWIIPTVLVSIALIALTIGGGFCAWKRFGGSAGANKEYLTDTINRKLRRTISSVPINAMEMSERQTQDNPAENVSPQ